MAETNLLTLLLHYYEPVFTYNAICLLSFDIFHHIERKTRDYMVSGSINEGLRFSFFYLDLEFESAHRSDWRLEMSEMDHILLLFQNSETVYTQTVICSLQVTLLPEEARKLFI